MCALVTGVQTCALPIWPGALALCDEDIEWIIPGQDWPLAGTRRGHAGLEDHFQKASETVETSFMEPREFVAQADRVLVVGFASGKIKATGKSFERSEERRVGKECVSKCRYRWSPDL